MVNLIGKRGEKELSEIGFTTQMVSMGHQACGALELWNYPVWLRDVVPQNVDGTDRSNNVDLASLESKYIYLSFTDQFKKTLVLHYKKSTISHCFNLCMN